MHVELEDFGKGIRLFYRNVPYRPQTGRERQHDKADRGFIVTAGPDEPFAAVERLAAALSANARPARHRCALCLTGDPQWTLGAAQAALRATGVGDALWISTRAPSGVRAIPASEARGILGAEVDHVVFDAFSGFDPDAFGAVGGTIRAGGILILLTPPPMEWPDFDDPENARITVHPYPPEAVTGRYLERFAHILARDPECLVLGKEDAPDTLASPPGGSALTRPEEARPGPHTIFRTDDQRIAVEAVLKVATGHRRRPAVLTSDRGRGKSAALGISAALLLEKGKHRVVVTAPSLSTASPLFRHAAALLPDSNVKRGHITLGAGEIVFSPPDELVGTLQPADLVLVDEAAAIPAQMLEALLVRYARIAFATTVHGYEGTGMGFSVRFHEVLNRRTNRWCSVRLETPIRWAEHDPLERLVFRGLLLDADPADDEALRSATPGACTVERLDRDALAKDERTLSELFGLLVLAHYQTRPADLRHLLDGPNLSVCAMRYRGRIAATALIAAEGGFDAEEAGAIYENRRRPHGHLLPETLAVHLGFEEAPLLRGARVMRIAVHPDCQGRGLGTHLLDALIKQAGRENLDWVGASFGATPRLLGFWERNRLRPVRLGFRRGTTSGSHSAVVMRGLSVGGLQLVDEARTRFERFFPLWLSDPLRDLEPDLTAMLLIRDRPLHPVLEPRDWRDLVSFAFGGRGYDVNIGPIRELTLTALSGAEGHALLNVPSRNACILRVIQQRGWSETAETLDLTGRAAVTETLRNAIRILVRHYGGDT
ncbi:MAG: GNAT family N-acetyltransferase [Pseudomonadota bacterium]|nr:GNAT family N-acetyltransferase [Pseudomonadota bacterium]